MWCGESLHAAWRQTGSYTSSFKEFSPEGLATMTLYGVGGPGSGGEGYGSGGGIDVAAGSPAAANLLGIIVGALEMVNNSIDQTNFRVATEIQNEGTPYEVRRAYVEVGTKKDIARKIRLEADIWYSTSSVEMGWAKALIEKKYGIFMKNLRVQGQGRLNFVI